MVEWYIDGHGYWRGQVEHSNLVHRQVAYEEIYLPNRHLYPLPFSQYQVHHRDRNKRNNHPSNLSLVTRKQHARIHGIRGNSFYFYLTRGLLLAAVICLITGKIALSLGFLELLFTVWVLSIPIRIARRLLRW